MHFQINAYDKCRDGLEKISGILGAAKAFSATESLQKQFGAIIGMNEAHNVMKALSASEAFQKSYDKLSGIHAAQSMIENRSALASIQKHFDSITAMNKEHHLSKILSASDSFHKRFDYLAGNSVAQHILKTLSASASFSNAMEALSKPANFSAVIDLIATGEVFTTNATQTFDFELEANELDRQLEVIGKSTDLQSFLDALNKIPAAVQTVILFILLHLILPVADNITANLITPHVEQLLSEGKPKRETINQIKSLPLDGLDLSNHRFITANQLHLRKNPNSKSEIIDELQLGQIVTILSKQRNWIEVTYEYKNGEMMRGWVYTRYTAKFEK